MQSEDFVNRKGAEQSLQNHAPCPALVLLGWLKDEVHGPVQVRKGSTRRAASSNIAV
jgi:hypothetical protein